MSTHVLDKQIDKVLCDEGVTYGMAGFVCQIVCYRTHGNLSIIFNFSDDMFCMICTDLQDFSPVGATHVKMQECALRPVICPSVLWFSSPADPCIASLLLVVGEQGSHFYPHSHIADGSAKGHLNNRHRVWSAVGC